MREHASPDHGTHEEPAACGCDTGASTAPVVAPPRGTAEAMVYRIPTMDCAAEEGEIRHALKDVLYAGITSGRHVLSNVSAADLKVS